jgi:hypothetical protein
MALTPEEQLRIYNEAMARKGRGRIKIEQNKKAVSCAGIGCAAVLGTLCMLWVIGSLFNHGAKSLNHGVKSTDSDNIGAYVYAEQFVRSRLKAPSTAKFCGFSEANVMTLAGNSYQVTGWVDAQNGFGAMLRTNFACKLHAAGTTWYLDDISLTPR